MSEHLQLQFLHEIDKLTSKKYAETINLLFAGNKLFPTLSLYSPMLSLYAPNRVSMGRIDKPHAQMPALSKGGQWGGMCLFIIVS